jgi:hypothetical protein
MRNTLTGVEGIEIPPPPLGNTIVHYKLSIFISFLFFKVKGKLRIDLKNAPLFL